MSKAFKEKNVYVGAIENEIKMSCINKHFNTQSTNPLMVPEDKDKP